VALSQRSSSRHPVLASVSATETGAGDGSADAETAADARGDSAGDAEAEAGSVLCDPSFLLCEGFEGTLDAWAVDTQNDGGVSIDSTMAHHGRSSLHARLPADTLDMRAKISPLPPRSWGRPVYFRFFLYLNVAHQAYLNVFALVEPSPSQSVLVLSAEYGPAFSLDAVSTPDGGTSGATSPFALHQWIRVEIAVDGANATLWRDGNLLASVSFAEPTENLKMDLGLTATGGPTDPAYDAWFDDMAVSNTRIGCDR
jgi:hypothetical protein